MQLRDGRDAYTIEGKRNDPNLPESLRYDTPATIRGVITPVYRNAHRREKVRERRWWDLWSTRLARWLC